MPGSSTRIDVLIPAIPKDLVTLPHVINSIRKYVKHPIGRIMIIAPKNQRIINFCRRKGCRFINEASVLPIGKKGIYSHTGRWNRAGWLYQQLLKLSGDKLSSQRFFLVIDADTVLIRPHLFRINKKTVFYCRNWTHQEYKNAYRKLLGKRATSPVSFVTHYMLFDRAKLSRLKRIIASRHNRNWYIAILDRINKSKPINFSEFETYGNFVRSHYPGAMIIRSSMNKSLSSNFLSLSGKKVKKLARKYRSISFHKRKIYFRK
ncbi:DUF6492 family protein [Brevibacillus reuszeri]|uniref:DUF6492 family protein n=1 Tax=Brevibacillus reuszeri TaxID=54915 RepID=UPI003D1A8ACD